ncbi:LPD7 domain-containing protein [Cupriavidus necator]
MPWHECGVHAKRIARRHWQALMTRARLPNQPLCQPAQPIWRTRWRHRSPPPRSTRGHDPSASVRAPILTANGYALPAAVAARYRVQDGHFWSTSPASSPSRSYKGARETQGATARPKAAFIDQGPRLATRDHDRTTVADMVAVARAKHWATITLRGAEKFRRHAWLEASLAGLKVKGFTPSPHDLAMLQGAKRDSEALRITPAAAQPAMTTPTAPPVQPVRIPVEPIASTPPLAPTGMASLAMSAAQTATSEATSKTAAVHIKAVRQAFEQTIAGYPEATRGS